MTFSSSVKWIVAAAVVIGAVLWGKSKLFPPAAPILPGVVTKRDLIQRVTLSGKIVPKRRADIKAPFAGYIEKMYVRIGDKVKAGDPLVTFSPSLGRGETNFPVRAAFPGVVTQTQRTEGEYATESDGKIVLRVDDMSELHITGVVPELDVAKIKPGQEAAVGLSSLVGESFKAVMTDIALSSKDEGSGGYSSSASAEFMIRARLESKDPRLLPGMSVLLDIVTQEAKDALTLPHEYVLEENGKYFVTTAAGEKKEVELGLRTEEAIQIKSGLKEGDEVRSIDFLSLPKVTD